MSLHTPPDEGVGARLPRQFPNEVARAAYYAQAWAELVECNAAADLALAEHHEARRRERTPDRQMAVYAAETLLRIRQWAFEHHNRACNRGLEDGIGAAALMHLVEFVDILRFEIEAGAGGVLSSCTWFMDGVAHHLYGVPDGASDFVAMVGAVDHALAQAREATEEEWHTADVAAEGDTDSAIVACDRDCVEAMQSIDLEISKMRELWSTFRAIEECRHYARTGEYEPLDAQLSACEHLAFAPGMPMEDNDV